MQIKEPLPGKEHLPGVARSKEHGFKMPKTNKEQEKLAKKLGIKTTEEIPLSEKDIEEVEDLTHEAEEIDETKN